MFGPRKQNLRGQNNNFGGTNDLKFDGTKQGFWGEGIPNNDFGGTKGVFGPQKQNLRGENNDFGGTNDLEFEGTKPGFWGDQTLILGGPTECLSLLNFHFLVNLGLQFWGGQMI